MMKYIVCTTAEADKDLVELAHYKAHQLQAPHAAAAYMKELVQTIQQLELNPDSIAFSDSEYIQQNYGVDARHAAFENVVIIFLIDGGFVHISRVIPKSLVL